VKRWSTWQFANSILNRAKYIRDSDFAYLGLDEDFHGMVFEQTVTHSPTQEQLVRAIS